MAGILELGGEFGDPGAYSDPARLWVHTFTPKNLKQLFRWTEYLFNNSAQIYAGVKKFAEYPITEITYNTQNTLLKDQYKKILEETLGIKRVLIQASLDLQIYGNSLASVHLPFKRFLECKECKSRLDIRYSKFKLRLKNLEFSFECEECKKNRPAKVVDIRIIDPKKINVIRWDPKLIDINYNSVTNEAVYYLHPDEELVTKVKDGDAHLISTLPMAMLKTISEDNMFQFNSGEIFHMRADCPAGLISGWGYPPLTSTMHLFYHASILRKANEAIALERLTPMRVMHPQATSGNADPILTMAMQKWIDDTKANIREWRRDPNHMMFSPVAIGMTQVGGDGRALLVDAEINRAEDNIIAAMGFPKEFIYGGLSFTGSSVTLRMLENQLETSVFQIVNLLRWITEKVSKYMKIEYIQTGLGDFKMLDDVQQKQILMSMWQAGVISKTTITESNGIDIAAERKKIKDEQIADAKLQQEIQSAVQKLQNSLAAQAQAQAAQGSMAGMQYDQQAVIGQADGLAQQLMQMDPGSRKSQLASLQAEDYVMYSVVIQRMEQMNLDMQNQAQAQMAGGGAPMPAPAQGAPM